MDYEKKYKEAIEKAKRLYEKGTITESLSYIFPELKKSEDEKIRRNIIAALKGEGYYDCDLTNECIAWIEKQGYTKKDVDEIIKTAEDHAYFAGSENAREKLIDKACKWWEDELSYPSMTPLEVKWYKSKVRKFCKAMEDE